MLEWCWNGVGVVLEWLEVAWNGVGGGWRVLEWCCLECVLVWCWSLLMGVGVAWNGVGVVLEWLGVAWNSVGGC